MAAYKDEGKMYTFVKGFASGANLEQTLNALTFAREKHKGQFRKSGDPYLIHPLTMTCHAISLGIRDDAILASLLFHDVVEDCSITADQLPVDKEVQQIVSYLTFIPNKDVDKEVQKFLHYERMQQCEKACICKLFDRCHNVSSMSGTFTREKIDEYINETYTHVLPLYRIVKDKWPKYQDILFALKFHICSVVDSIKAAIETYNK
jgi:GTP pyrophosphokinase